MQTQGSCKTHTHTSLKSCPSLAYHIQLDHLIQHLRALPICLLVVTLGQRMPLLKCLQAIKDTKGVVDR